MARIPHASCIVAALIVGCGDDAPRAKPARNVVPVFGTLTYQGKPLQHFNVSFIPDVEGAHTAVGTSDADGKFTLGTNKPGDGAAIGSYKAAIVYAGPTGSEDNSVTAMPIDDPKMLPQPPVRIPERFARPETSQLQYEVPAGGLKDLVIDLK